MRPRRVAKSASAAKFTAAEVGEMIKALVEESQRDGEFVIPVVDLESKLSRLLDDPILFSRYRLTLQNW